ncbi:nuclear transport factor 2 family protein [Rhodococcus sp. NPDC003318]|uniref:nuclear transport factor 2 family protein n=1 Tax=Rhodococcus sp. NPDC003318 TaxID=3364503 RepID=UPI0036AC8DF6
MTTTDDLVTTLTDRVQALEDRLAITNLIASYGPAVDSGQAAKVSGLWTEDGVYDVDTGAMHGRTEIEAMVHSRNHQSYIHSGSGHLLYPPHITLDGDSAVATCHSQLVLRDNETGVYRVARITANRWEFSRIDGEWKVTRRVGRVLDGGDEGRGILSSAL